MFLKCDFMVLLAMASMALSFVLSIVRLLPVLIGTKEGKGGNSR